MFAKYSVVLLFLCSFYSFSQDRPDYNLLWRIESPDSEKVSYLFGTAHIKNNLAYDFSDSVLIAFDNSEVIALEINNDEYFQLLLNERFEEKERNYLKEELSETEYEKLKENVKEDLDFRIEDLKTVSPKMIRRMYSDHFFDPKENSLTVDNFFYDTGKKLGKEILGLERVNQGPRAAGGFQSKMEKESFVKEIIYDDESEEVIPEIQMEVFKPYFNFLNIYYQGNVDSIYAMFDSSYDLEADNLEMVSRNYIMLKSLDSILPLKSTFAAVGAAHLGGEKGLIQLLREKGYKLSPVQADFSGIAKLKREEFEKKGGYLLENIAQGYRIKLESRPSQIQIPNSTVKMMLSVNLLGSRSNLVFSIESTDVFLPKEEIMNEMISNMQAQSKAEITMNKEIEHMGLQGKVVTMASGTTNFLLYLFNKKNRYYLFGEVITSGKFSKSERKEFLSKIEFFDFTKPQTTWAAMTSKEGFSCWYPSNYEFLTHYEPMDEEGRNLELIVYSALDEFENSYATYSYKYPIGYTVETDTAFSDIMVETFGTEQGFDLLYSKSLNTSKGYDFSAMFANGKYFIKIKLKIRGNKPFVLVYQGKDTINSNLDRFFDSFKLNDLPTQIDLKPYDSKEGTYSFSAPLVREVDEQEAMYYSNILSTQFTKFSDQEGDYLINVTEYNYSPFTYFQNSDSLLAEFIYDIDSASILNDSTYKENSQGLMYDVFYEIKGNSYHQFDRIYVKGSKVFYFNCILPMGVSPTIFDPVFSSLKLKDGESFDFYTDKKELLFKSLQSNDSTVYKDACRALNSIILDSSDIPNILSIYNSPSTLDSGKYGDARNSLVDDIKNLKTRETMEFCADYFDTTQSPDLKSRFFSALDQNAVDLGPELYLERFNKIDFPTYYSYFFYDTVSNVLENYHLLIDALSNPYSAKLSLDILDNGLDLDSNFHQMLRSKESEILSFLKGSLDTINFDSIDYRNGFVLSSALSILIKLDALESENELLKKLSTSDFSSLKAKAFAGLLKNGVKVNSSKIEKFLENDEYPLAIINAFVSAGQESYLEKFIDQKEMAKIFIQSNLNDEGYGKLELNFLETQTVIINNEEVIVYYFYWENEWDETMGLGVSGWQPKGGKVNFVEKYSDIWSYTYSPESFEETKKTEKEYLEDTFQGNSSE